MNLACHAETVVCKRSDDVDLIFSISTDHEMFKNNEVPKYLLVQIFDRPVPFCKEFNLANSKKYEYRSFGVFDSHGALSDIKTESNTFYGEIYYIK